MKSVLASGILIVVALLTFSLPANAKDRIFVPVSPDGTTPIVYYQGAPVVQVDAQTYSAAVYFSPLSKKQGWVGVSVYNSGQEPFNIGPEMITVHGAAGALKTFTYDALMAAQKRKQKWLKALTIVAMVGNAASASYAGNQYHSGSVNGYGPGGSYSATYSGTTYSPSAAAAARNSANSQNMMLAQNAQGYGKDKEQTIKELALRTTTVQPSQELGGMIAVQLPKASRKVPAEFIVDISLNGETRQVLFREVFK